MRPCDKNSKKGHENREVDQLDQLAQQKIISSGESKLGGQEGLNSTRREFDLLRQASQVSAITQQNKTALEINARQIAAQGTGIMESANHHAENHPLTTPAAAAMSTIGITK